jgi:hypothetical protein
MTAHDLVTKSDLEQLERRLVETIKNATGSQQVARAWLRNSDLRRMFGLSYSTLQNLRINGKLKYVKLGRIIFYRREDVEAMLGEGDH